MTEIQLLATALSLLVSIVGFFLVKSYKTFEETRDDVKSLLIHGSARDEEIKNLSGDIHGLITKTNKHDERLQKVETKVELILQK